MGWEGAADKDVMDVQQSEGGGSQCLSFSIEHGIGLALVLGLRC